jgi:hypothetical protein
VANSHANTTLFALFLFLLFASCSQQTNENASAGDSFSGSKDNSLSKSTSLPIAKLALKEWSAPIDSLVIGSKRGDTVTTFVFEYIDTLPSRPVRKFLTRDRNDSIILSSFNTDFEFYGELADDDFHLILIPSYSFTESELEIHLFKSNGAAGYNSYVNLNDVFRGSLFKYYEMEDELLKIASIPLLPSHQKSRLLVTLKEPYIEMDSVISLISAINQRPLYEIEKKVLVENAFLHSYSGGKNSVIDKFMSQEVETSDESAGHAIKATQYFYEFFKFHQLIE